MREDVELGPACKVQLGAGGQEIETGLCDLCPAFSFQPGERNHVELRAQLLKDKQPASEVWLYRWTT